MSEKSSIAIGHCHKGDVFRGSGARLSVVIDYEDDRVYFELQRHWPDGRTSNARISTPQEARDYWRAVTDEIENRRAN